MHNTNVKVRIRMSVTKFRKTEFRVFIRVAISERIDEGPRGYIISNRSGYLGDDIQSII